MRAQLYRWLLPAALATATLVGPATTATAQPHVRDHRGPSPRVHNVEPREAPPPMREERVRPRGRGWVWVQGHWDWRNGRWEWTGGRWEKVRSGKRWRPVTWELRGGVYVRVDGDWIDDRPVQAPPPPREERFENRRGFVWVPGHWDWQNGQYVWVEGRYERERRGKRWRQPKWELRDGVWVRIDGDWDDDVPVGNYPTQAPPAPREERPGTKAGFVWVRGRYEWRNGNYEWVPGHWERERANERWIDGRWEYHDQRWIWIEGKWDRGGYTWADGKTYPWPEFPPEGPPPPQRDNVQSAPGKVWFPGRYVWREGKYLWQPGYLIDARPGYRFVPGSWDLRANGKWTWNNESWVPDSTSQPPPRPPTGGNPPPPSSGPTQPPPPPRSEDPGTKGGFVWIRGHYEWRNGQYEWIPGHWERERARQRWVDGRWELRGNVYVWVPGYWQ